jgi:phosphomevalonate kinase
MIDVQMSAPGKVIIAGEYSVLDGAPAICMAVDRRAHVSITSTDNDYHSVIAPGHSETVGRFRAGEDGIEWLDGETEYALLAAVWKNVAARPLENLIIVLDSNEFIDATSSSKIGIGSSAALTVALTAALDLATGAGCSVHRVAAAAHREFQGGKGSGADVACSLSGGVVEYRMGDAPDRALRWPDGLVYALLWSGVAASTTDKLRKLAGVDSVETHAKLVAASKTVAHAWHGDQPTDIVTALSAFTSVLGDFDVAHELGIFDAGHAELVSSAATSDIVYKPCGAGGGDLGIVIGANEAAVMAFVAVAQGRGFRHLPLAIETTGLRREGERY